MSLVKIEDIDARSAWGLWKIEESFTDLVHMAGKEAEHKFQNVGFLLGFDKKKDSDEEYDLEGLKSLH